MAITVVSYTDLGAAFGPWGASTSIFPSGGWQVGDIIVGIESNAASQTTFAVPTATGETFTERAGYHSTGSPSTAVFTCTAVTNSPTGSITANGPGSSDWGAYFWVLRGATGIGNTMEQHTSALTTTMTAAATSFVCWGAFDWLGKTVTGTTPVPGTATQRELAQDTNLYSMAVYEQNGTAGGAQSWGIANNTSAGPWSIVGIEIQGAATPHPNWGRVKI